MSCCFRRKCRGKLKLFSEKVKSKPHSSFIIHATPFYGEPEDTSIDVNEKGDEQLEMKSFGKSGCTVNHKGMATR